MWKDKGKDGRPSRAIAALDYCSALLPNISILRKILATLPVTTAQTKSFFESRKNANC